MNSSGLYDKQTSINYYEERYAQGYMEKFPVELKEKIFEVIHELQLSENGEALDFGCGNGRLTEVIKQALPKWQVYGTDVSNVAIEKAKKSYPNCTFFVTGDKEFADKKFDFMFTHHVLEHVYNLRQVFDEMHNCLKTTSAMLHILPCGNEGSFEYSICRLRKDGVNSELENRFFFEEEGHVRRLNTEQLSNLCSEKGFALTKEYYSYQYHGAINWITQSGPGFVRTLTDISSAIDEDAKRKLQKLRYYLLGISMIRYAVQVESKWNKRDKTVKDYILLLGGLAPYIFAKPVDLYWKSKAREEWRMRKTERNGSEMFLYFTR